MLTRPQLAARITVLGGALDTLWQHFLLDGEPFPCMGLLQRHQVELMTMLQEFDRRAEAAEAVRT